MDEQVKKIKKILIANRGEIALRIIGTCRELGIKTITLYAPEEKKLPHALYSDEAILLEGQTLSETYLNQDLLISIAKEKGADAIHPGYGFLSENDGFAKKVEDSGLIFIGPTPDVILLMGDKIQSKLTAQKYNLPNHSRLSWPGPIFRMPKAASGSNRLPCFDKGIKRWWWKGNESRLQS
jgi:acetyl/propionyl-CoA carboxylase alpha subunit